MDAAEALPPWPSRAALFLDLDGTLLEIADHPRLAVASARLRSLLPALPGIADGAVAVISGRPLEEVDRILAPHAFVAAGVHGLERRDASGRRRSAAVPEHLPADVRECVGRFAARHAGVLLEDKALSLAVHYRARPELEPAIHTFAAELQQRLPEHVEVLLGKKVLEIKPSVMNKGDAIRAFMQEPPFAGRCPVFVGDDVTDEAGFAAVNALEGISIKVGAGATAAAWRLADVGAVLGWLERVAVRRVGS
jgi:trehalose 6-phosphate phosphatase